MNEGTNAACRKTNGREKQMDLNDSGRIRKKELKREASCVS